MIKKNRKAAKIWVFLQFLLKKLLKKKIETVDSVCVNGQIQ